MLKEALKYKSIGWIPIPLNGKIPTINGWQNTKIEDSIKPFESFKQMNIGIICGKVSNIFVLDIDVKDNGLDTLKNIETQYGILDTVCCETSSGGKHYYFNYEEKFMNFGNRVRVPSLPGFDLKTNKGQVVAPPSIGTNKRMYKWIKDPFTFTISNMPEWLFELLLKNLSIPNITTTIINPNINPNINNHNKRGLKRIHDYYNKTSEQVIKIKLKNTARLKIIIPQLSIVRATAYDSWIHIIHAAKGHSYPPDELLTSIIKFSSKSIVYNEKSTRYQYEKGKPYTTDFIGFTMEKIEEWFVEDVNPIDSENTIPIDSENTIPIYSDNTIDSENTSKSKLGYKKTAFNDLIDLY